MKPPSTGKLILVAILDLLLVFVGGGILIASATGQMGPNGFNLTGLPALLLIVLVIGYFIVFPRWLGGTLFQRLFGIAGWRRRSGG